MVDPYAGLNERLMQLTKWKNQISKELMQAPKGTLIVRSRGQSFEWYYIPEGTGSEKETYLKKKDSITARALAQRDYNKKALRAIKKEIKALRTFACSLPKIRAEMMYEDLSKGRQELVAPLVLPDLEYARQWENRPYIKKSMSENTPVHLTMKGERVRSKSEVLIADHLARKGYPYRYEQQISINGKTFCPDFTILDPVTRKVYYWEHLGKLDDPAYVKEVVKKLQFYAKNGIVPGVNLILTWETSEDPLNAEQIEAMLRQYFH